LSHRPLLSACAKQESGRLVVSFLGRRACADAPPPSARPTGPLTRRRPFPSRKSLSGCRLPTLLAQCSGGSTQSCLKDEDSRRRRRRRRQKRRRINDRRRRRPASLAVGDRWAHRTRRHKPTCGARSYARVRRDADAPASPQ